jgi:hypothetical protein
MEKIIIPKESQGIRHPKEVRAEAKSLQRTDFYTFIYCIPACFKDQGYRQLYHNWMT